MANNFNSNNFYFDKSMYLKDKNNRINRDNYTLSDDNLQPKNPDEYQFQFYDRFDTYKGLFNTQQFIGSIDFDNFANHCFFDSAVSKTEYAFNTIYDKFPFDGTKQEVDDFFKNIDGFTKTIYNKFDKNIGYLRFNNSYISVQNKSGYIFSSQRNEKIDEKISNPILDPGLSSFAIDFRCYIEDTSTANQIIFQYLDRNGSKNNGFTFYIKDFFQIGQNKFANVVFLLSNNDDYDSVSFCKFVLEIKKWHHVILSIENTNKSNKKLNVILNEAKISLDLMDFSNSGILDSQKVKFEKFISSKKINISNLTNFKIGGNGSMHIVGNTYFDLSSFNNFKGYIDEFRFYHSSLDEKFSIKFKDRNVYATDALKLYFRFNEPTGIYTNNSLVFDHSGNSLHSRIQFLPQITDSNAFKTAISNLRIKTVIGKSPLKFEEYDLNPVIIPSYDTHIALNEQYLEEATAYDKYNPNLVFKLFPRNYFIEGAIENNTDEIYKNENVEKYYKESTYDYPGRQKKEAQQAFANLLIIWARFFDQLKLYLQVLPKMIDLEYSDINNKSSAVNFFIPLMAKMSGFDFKEILNSPTNKILDGYILGADGEDKSEFTLRFIQNEIWKRILINSRDIITSKGTKQSIRSIFNSVGIIPEDYYRFREFGTNSNSFVDESFSFRSKNLQYLKFKGSTNSNKVAISTLPFYEYKINTNKLTINPGNKFKFNINSQGEADANFKNLNIEFFLNYDNSASLDKNILIESILKIEKNENNFPVYYEIVFIKDDNFSKKGNLYLFFKNSSNQILYINEINLYKKIENIDLMDGSYWHFSLQFTKKNINKIKLTIQRAGFSNQFEKIHMIDFETSQNIHVFDGNESIISFGSRVSLSSSGNRNGSCLYSNESSSIDTNPFYGKFTNTLIDYNHLFEENLNFNGNISFFKIWKSYIEVSQKEITLHAKNPFSVSCADLLLSNKNNKKIKDFLMLDLNMQEKLNEAQDISLTPGSDIKMSSCNKIIDYSQNLDLSTDFSIYRNIVSYDFIQFTTSSEKVTSYASNKSLYLAELDTKFDELNETNKVKIGGFISNELAEKENISIAPVYSINQYINKNKSDSRFSVEMSNTKHLNEDISFLFSSLEYWSNNLSSFSNLNEISYVNFEKVRDLYFERIVSSSLNMTPLYEIYQIFDNVLTELLQQFISSRVKFNNNIYVIESHSLERHKYYYKQYESQSPIIGNFKSEDGQSWINSLSFSKRNINYLNKEGRILREDY